MKKIIIMLMCIICITGLCGCGSDETTSGTDTEGGFVLEYPADMQELGFTEPMVLDEVPAKVVTLSAAPVIALYEMDANIVGATASSVVDWPEDLMEEVNSVTFSAMSSGDYDFESVLALEPDLVFMPSLAADTAGVALESLGVNVYYVYSGHTMSYASVKAQTEAIANAFAVDEEGEQKKAELMGKFDDLEEKIAQVQDTFAGKKVLVLQSGSETAHYAQTKNGTLGSMLDVLGFVNVYENESTNMALLDYEQALSYDPDYIVCVGSADEETHMEMIRKGFDLNPEYWGAMKAVQEDNVIFVGVEFIASSGVNVVERITELYDIMCNATGIDAE